ncbi:hypothetical protein L210DRAFT_3649479 [Boletus edulis BED1]|uniref:Uncharacterized protein n=1 Tax=Boletus edulis BED1 TaxID=1328754 RepID=A0AAD4BM35_BOLED|nr:hypothetical protein L210DRAFT_3649479 [Boletus edulis BED1]
MDEDGAEPGVDGIEYDTNTKSSYAEKHGEWVTQLRGLVQACILWIPNIDASEGPRVEGFGISLDKTCIPSWLPTSRRSKRRAAPSPTQSFCTVQAIRGVQPLYEAICSFEEGFDNQFQSPYTVVTPDSDRAFAEFSRDHRS